VQTRRRPPPHSQPCPLVVSGLLPFLDRMRRVKAAKLAPTPRHHVFSLWFSWLHGCAYRLVLLHFNSRYHQKTLWKGSVPTTAASLQPSHHLALACLALFDHNKFISYLWRQASLAESQHPVWLRPGRALPIPDARFALRSFEWILNRAIRISDHQNKQAVSLGSGPASQGEKAFIPSSAAQSGVQVR
jgi:hypothetical protein